MSRVARAAAGLVPGLTFGAVAGALSLAPAAPPAAKSCDSAGCCPHGALEDPHRGFVRCLAKGEDAGAPFVLVTSRASASSPSSAAPRSSATASGAASTASALPAQPVASASASASVLPSASAAAPPSASPSASASSAPSASSSAKPAAPPTAKLDKWKLEGGDAPKAQAAVEKKLAELGKCVGDAGGLSGRAGSVRVQLLLRGSGRAEGVEVDQLKNVPSGASACLRNVLKKTPLGTPTADLVAVSFVLELKAP